MSETPNDPITVLAAAASQTHELFLSFCAAGFTEYQALYLTAAAITGRRSDPPQP